MNARRSRSPIGSSGKPREGAAGPVEIGQISKAHGLRGEVVVVGVRLSLEEFEDLGTLEARARDGSSRTLTLENVRPFMQSLLVTFEEVRDRDEAEALHGQVLEVARDRLPARPDGEVYLFQLVGLLVETDDGRTLGRVADVLPTGATPVLVVREGADQGGRERLLPMSAEVLVSVDTALGRVVVHLLPGMEEL